MWILVFDGEPFPGDLDAGFMPPVKVTARYNAFKAMQARHQRSPKRGIESPQST